VEVHERAFYEHFGLKRSIAMFASGDAGKVRFRVVIAQCPIRIRKPQIGGSIPLVKPIPECGTI